ncbi:MAG TPA: FHA domain-containing protein [Solirubrobacteraceae bacterium]|nr:FHA domain-containing protein [Solirubrobacteraceae bacterium]
MDGFLLQIVLGPAAGTQIDVQGELLIGRHVDGLGQLGDDPDLSRGHALISFTHGQLTIADLGSTNGTWYLYWHDAWQAPVS